MVKSVKHLDMILEHSLDCHTPDLNLALRFASLRMTIEISTIVYKTIKVLLPILPQQPTELCLTSALF